MDPVADSTFEAPKGVLLRRNRLVLAIPAALGVLGALSTFGLILADQNGQPTSSAIPGVLIAVGMIVTPLLWSANAFPIVERGALRVAADGISLGGRVALRREDITGASFARLATFRGMDPVVRLTVRGRQWASYLRVADEAAARAVLAALRLDVGHARATFVLPWWPFRQGTWLAAYVFAMFGVFACASVAFAFAASGERVLAPWGGLLAALLLIVGFAVVRWRSRMELTLGADGFLVSQWGRSRFLPATEVEEARQWPPTSVKGHACPPNGFDLVLRSGERIGMYTALERQRLHVWESDFILDQVREVLRQREAPASEAPRWVASRKGRTASEWLTELRRIGSGGAVDLRVAPVDSTELWRVVASLDAAPSDRAAAAAALSASGEAATPTRLRAMAASTASPELRVALEAAADGDDPELERALDELESKGAAVG